MSINYLNPLAEGGCLTDRIINIYCLIKSIESFKKKQKKIFLSSFYVEAIEASNFLFLDQYISDESINRYYYKIKIYIGELYLNEKLCLNQFEEIVIPYSIRPLYGLIGH